MMKRTKNILSFLSFAMLSVAFPVFATTEVDIIREILNTSSKEIKSINHQSLHLYPHYLIYGIETGGVIGLNDAFSIEGSLEMELHFEREKTP